MVRTLEELIQEESFTHHRLIIEQPELWGAYKSVASAHSGSLLGLYLLTGALFGWAIGKNNIPRLIPVSEWKGQLPKEIIAKRMIAKYHVTFATDHESDAVGLGDYFCQKYTSEMDWPVIAIDPSINTLGWAILEVANDKD